MPELSRVPPDFTNDRPALPQAAQREQQRSGFHAEVSWPVGAADLLPGSPGIGPTAGATQRQQHAERCHHSISGVQVRHRGGFGIPPKAVQVVSLQVGHAGGGVGSAKFPQLGQ